MIFLKRKFAGGVLPALIVSLGAMPAAMQAADAQRDYREHVAPLVKNFCIDCHSADEPEADFRLEGLTGDMRGERFAWAAALERLLAGDMPPEDADQPDAAAREASVKWIKAQLAAPIEGDVASDMRPAPIKPVDGNRVPHALLFTAYAGETIPPPPRLWRMRPSGYSDGFAREVRGRGPVRLSQPFNFHGNPGIKDYAELYSIDGPATDTLLRNAERIVESQTVHKIKFDKEAGPEGRVSMSHDTIGEFKPLLHPKIAPTREELVKAIEAQYRLALVRKPSEQEVAALLALYDANLKVADKPGAAKAMLMAPLLSPEATHRFELGRGAEVRPGVRMLSPLEIAFAVTLTLADRRDQALFKAAEKGELTTRESVAQHVRRMLYDPKIAKPQMLQFFREYFGYANASEIFKDKPKDVLHTPDQMVKDTDQLVEYLVEQDKDVFRQLLTTPKSFVNCGVHYAERTREKSYKRGREAHPINDKGRKHPEAAYGVEEWTDKQPLELPNDRIGILMQPSWLVAWSTNFDNDPVRRGRWIRERLLGGRVPDLPLGVVAQVPDDPHRTLRDRLTVTRDAACWKCHQKMDELGLPFEAFDHYGKPRTVEMVLDVEATEKHVDKNGKPLGPVTREAELVTTGIIEASGDPRLDAPVKNAQEMIRRIANSDRARQVFIRHVFRHTMGRNETPGDAKTLQEADRAYLASGGSYKELLVSLISSESFLYRSVPSSARGAE